MNQSKTPIGFWCRSHRCHGNPIFCGNFLVSAHRVQFFSDRLQVWHVYIEVYYGKTKRPIVFGVGGVIVAMVTTFFVKFL